MEEGNIVDKDRSPLKEIQALNALGQEGYHAASEKDISKQDNHSRRISQLNWAFVKRLGRLLKIVWRNSPLSVAFTLLSIIAVTIVFSYTQAKTYSISNGIPTAITKKIQDGDDSTLDGVYLQMLLWSLVSSSCIMIWGFFSEVAAAMYRKAIVQYVQPKYLAVHYDVVVLHKGNIDNPDQRLTDDLSMLVESMKTIVAAWYYIAQSIAYPVYVAITPLGGPVLLAIMIVFGLFVTLISILMARWPTPHVFSQDAREGHLRFHLARVRQYAESLALYRAGSMMAQRTLDALKDTLWFAQRVAYAMIPLQTSWELLFSGGTMVVPLLVAFQITHGAFLPNTNVVDIPPAELSSAIRDVNMFAELVSFMVIISVLQALPSLASSTHRVMELLETCEACIRDKSQSSELDSCGSHYRSLSAESSVALSLQDITLTSPGGQRTIAKDLTISLRPGENLLISGDSGIGKSSLLRCACGLWRPDKGIVSTPPLLRRMGQLNSMLFVPQKPYLPRGSLRDLVIYPLASDVSVERGTMDSRILNALVVVDLQSLVETCKSRSQNPLDAYHHQWESELSPGEQQRISFARVVFHRPSLVLLDEATASVDFDIEKELYEHVVDNLDVTVVSVAHRSAVARYHHVELKLSGNGAFTITALRDFSTPATKQTPDDKVFDTVEEEYCEAVGVVEPQLIRDRIERELDVAVQQSKKQTVFGVSVFRRLGGLLYDAYVCRDSSLSFAGRQRSVILTAVIIVTVIAITVIQMQLLGPYKGTMMGDLYVMGLNAQGDYENGEVTWSTYLSHYSIWALCCIVASLLGGALYYVYVVLGLSMRSKILRKLAPMYLSNNTYYWIDLMQELDGDGVQQSTSKNKQSLAEKAREIMINCPCIDNADERLVEDLSEWSKAFSFTVYTLMFPLIQFFTVLIVMEWGMAGWIIGGLGTMTFITGTFLCICDVFVSRKRFQRSRMEGQWRNGHTKLRDFSESIALYGATEGEAQFLAEAYEAVYSTHLWGSVWAGIVLAGRVGLGSIFTFAFVNPWLAGKIAERNVSSTTTQQEVETAFSAAASIIQLIALRIVKLLEVVARWGIISGLTNRVGELRQSVRSISAIQELCQNTDQDGVGVQDVPDSADNNGGILLDAVDISLSTPDGQRRLLDRASLQLSRNTNVLCMGRSGLGKSSMARAIGGLWFLDSGTIKIFCNDMIIIPQVPFLDIGSVGSLVTFPEPFDAENDEAVRHAWECLQEAGLGKCFTDLITTANIREEWSSPLLTESSSCMEALGVHTSDNCPDSFGATFPSEAITRLLRMETKWDDILTPGEQQRISFARLFHRKPVWVLMDEATSALDTHRARQLYEKCAEKGITIMSIAHDDNVRTFHEKVVVLKDHRWQTEDGDFA